MPVLIYGLQHEKTTNTVKRQNFAKVKKKEKNRKSSSKFTVQSWFLLRKCSKHADLSALFIKAILFVYAPAEHFKAKNLVYLKEMKRYFILGNCFINSCSYFYFFVNAIPSNKKENFLRRETAVKKRLGEFLVSLDGMLVHHGKLDPSKKVYLEGNCKAKYSTPGHVVFLGQCILTCPVQDLTVILI